MYTQNYCILRARKKYINLSTFQRERVCVCVFFITTKAKTVHAKETDRWHMKLLPAKHIHTKYESTTKLND